MIEFLQILLVSAIIIGGCILYVGSVVVFINWLDWAYCLRDGIQMALFMFLILTPILAFAIIIGDGNIKIR